MCSKVRVVRSLATPELFISDFSGRRSAALHAVALLPPGAEPLGGLVLIGGGRLACTPAAVPCAGPILAFLQLEDPARAARCAG